mmetsp:Transcript_16289/g.28097  ORF Transcript_16289/g.28097 Transcript_16289/m.28097 type:complete len:875 (-) Transcript_16289:349-2973(-)
MFITPGVNGNGYCVLRCFKDKYDADFFTEFNILGRNLEVKKLEQNTKEEEYRFCFTVKGPDLTRDDAKELGSTLYIYSQTNTEQSKMMNAIQALAVSALASGMCRFSTHVSGTFSNPAPSRSNANSLSGRSLNSGGSSRSNGSTRSRFSLRNALSSFRGKKSFDRDLPSPTPVPQHSEEILAKDPAKELNPTQLFTLGTVVQCSRYLNDFPFNETATVRLFRRLTPGAQEASGTLERQLSEALLLNGTRPSLGKFGVDVVADNLLIFLSRVRPKLIMDSEYRRYCVAMEKQQTLGIDMSKSQAALQATARLVRSLGYEKAYVLQQLVSVMTLCSAKKQLELSDVLLSRIFGGLVVETLEHMPQKSDEYPHGLLSMQDAAKVVTLFRTLCCPLNGPSLFDSYLGDKLAYERICHITKDLPDFFDSNATAKKDTTPNEMNTLPSMWSQGDVDEPASDPTGNTAANLASASAVVDLGPKLTETKTSIPAKANIVKTKQIHPDSNSEELDKIALGALGGVVLGGSIAAATTIKKVDDDKSVPSPISQRVQAEPQTEHEAAGVASLGGARNLEPSATERGGGVHAPPILTAAAAIGQINAIGSITQKQKSLSPPGSSPKSPILDNDPNRVKTLEKMIDWYQSRLETAPNARNAHLWRREIKELSQELSNIRGGLAPLCHIEEPTVGIGGGPSISSIREIFERSKRSSADTLMKTQSPAKSKRNETPNNVNTQLDRDSKVDYHPYLNRPLSALEDSDEQLQQIMIDTNILAKKISKHARHAKRHRRRMSTGDASSEAGKDDLNSEELLIDVLKDNIRLRIELNEYQKGLIQRTQEKAIEFEQAFKERRPSLPDYHSPVTPQRPTQPQQPTSTWSALVNMF